MKQQIKHRWSDLVLFECELADGTENPMREAVIQAVKSEANLSWANLSRADLSNVDLSKAYLARANLARADLSNADLSNADLSKAYLSEAGLSEANLSGTDLSEADLAWANLARANLARANLSRAGLSRANLSGANLSKANLSGAYLTRTNLSEANLSEAAFDPIKGDFWMILLSAPFEIAGLRLTLIEGRVDGSAYQGECACLVGTIANIRHKNYEGIGVKPDSTRAAERWFMGIKKGDTPETSQISAITVKWIDEFVAKLDIAAGKTTT